MLRRLLAWWYKYPYEVTDFWPPFYISFGHEAPNGSKVLKAIYHVHIGNVVAVFQDNKRVHYYRLRSTRRASGSDHIVSPLQFHIIYHSSRKVA